MTENAKEDDDVINQMRRLQWSWAGGDLDVVMRWIDHKFLNSGKEPYVKKWAGLAEIETTITLFITF